MINSLRQVRDIPTPNFDATVIKCELGNAYSCVPSNPRLRRCISETTVYESFDDPEDILASQKREGEPCQSCYSKLLQAADHLGHVCQELQQKQRENDMALRERDAGLHEMMSSVMAELFKIGSILQASHAADDLERDGINFSRIQQLVEALDNMKKTHTISINTYHKHVTCGGDTVVVAGGEGVTVGHKNKMHTANNVNNQSEHNVDDHYVEDPTAFRTFHRRQRTSPLVDDIEIITHDAPSM